MSRVSFWLLTLAAGWVLGFLVNASARDSDLSWAVELTRVKRSIAETLIGSHRVLLVGGSHTHYSLSAMQIEERLGCPSVNLGLHAGLGLSAILEDAATVVRAGDVVVVTPEYGILTGTGSNWLAAGFGAATQRLGIGGDGVAERTRLAFAAGTATLTTVGKTLWTMATGEGGRAVPRVNERGDTVVFLYDLKPIPEHAMRLEVAPSMLLRLRKYRDELAARGAALVFNLPSMLVEDGDEVSRATAARVAQQLGRLAPVITHGEGFNLESNRSLFSDSFYHLTPESRAIYSHRFADHLDTVIASFGWSCRQPQ